MLIARRPAKQSRWLRFDVNSAVTVSELQNPDTVRRHQIEERKRSSSFWQLVHALGSLKLALVLLTILAIACAVATFAEANFNTKIAQATIYKAPWFVFWLGLLCVNLFAVTLTRWPWQRKHLGFVITHYGIITLLIGALIGSKWGFEGNVILRTDTPPISRVITDQNIIQVESPDGRVYRMAFDPEVMRPSSHRLRHFSVPGSALTIVADAMSTSLRKEPELIPSSSSLPSASAGILLELSSPVAPTPVRVPLLLNTPDAQFDFFGLAHIRFLSQLPERKPRMISEVRMVFSHHLPVIEASAGSTGWTIELSPDGRLLTLTDPAHHSQNLEVAPLIGHSIQIQSATFSVDATWPDFEMRNGHPTSKSPDPRNPAILVRIQGPAQNGTKIPLLELSPNPSKNSLSYQLSRGGVVYASGELTKGMSFETGWADWKAKVLEFLPAAALSSKLVPSAESQGESRGTTGFRAFLQSPDGTRGPSEWIGAGGITTLIHRDQFVRIAYGLEILPLPFRVQLKDFQVPRYEGTSTPSNYISTLSFQDIRTGLEKQAIAKMNHPASFPGGWWAIISGLNYKFSQAQWNPSDLKETTLQVLYDPGWLLKWIGSLGICAGIAIMFYFTPKRS